MGDWELTTLGGVATISSGSAPPAAAGDFDVMGANGRIGSSPAANFGPGFLVGRVGAAGAITRVVSLCWASDNTLTVVPNTAIDEVFLGHMLTALKLEDLATKTAQPLVTQSELRKRPIALPPLEEQRRIAEILDSIDETIQATECVVAKLWTVREGVLRGKLSALLDYPMAPVEHLGAHVSVGIVVRPTQYYVPDGVPVLRSANVREGQLDMTNLVYMSPKFHSLMAKTAVVPGDLVTVRTGYPGTTAVVPSTVPEANCVDVVITRTGTSIDPEFLSLWINSEFGKGHVLARQGGLAQQHFNVSDMKVLPVPVVDLSTQRKLVDSDRALRLRPEAEQVGLDKLTATRVGLASDLLNGHVRTVAA